MASLCRTLDGIRSRQHRVVPNPGGRQQEQESALSQPAEPRYLRTAQVAELLQVSPKTVSRWAQEGMLPYVRTLGGHRRYPDRESESFWKPCPSHPRPANRTSRLTAPPSLLSMASVALLDHPPLDGE